MQLVAFLFCIASLVAQAHILNGIMMVGLSGCVSSSIFFFGSLGLQFGNLSAREGSGFHDLRTLFAESRGSNGPLGFSAEQDLMLGRIHVQQQSGCSCREREREMQ